MAKRRGGGRGLPLQFRGTRGRGQFRGHAATREGLCSVMLRTRGKARGAVYPSVGRKLIADTPRNRWQRARIPDEKFLRLYFSAARRIREYFALAHVREQLEGIVINRGILRREI